MRMKNMDIIIWKLKEKENNFNNINNNNYQYEFSFNNLIQLNARFEKETINQQMHNKAQLENCNRKILLQQQQPQQMSLPGNFRNNKKWNYCSITCIPPALLTLRKTIGNFHQNKLFNSIGKFVIKTTKKLKSNINTNTNYKKNYNYLWHTPFRLNFFTSTSILSASISSLLLLLFSCCLLTTATRMSTITTKTTLPTVYASNKNNKNHMTNYWPNTTMNLSYYHDIIERDAANNSPNDADDSNYDEEFDEYDALIRNKSAKGKYIGSPCNEMKCDPSLLHVSCDKTTLTCGCEKNYPVQVGLIKGCDKPKKLGEQCFYDETCIYSDENSLCVQVRHNALCQCAHGFHSVSYMKPTKRVFCTQDLQEINRTDFPTLLGVASGIAVLAGLICMVLHLFSKTKYPRNRNFAEHHGAPPIMYSSDTGIPLTVQSGRLSSRSSVRSNSTIGSYGNRRASSTGVSVDGAHGGGGGGGGGSGVQSAKGIMVSTSRTGAARTAAILLISCHISAISKQNSRESSRQTSGVGCSAQSHSRDTLHENSGGMVSINDAHDNRLLCDSTLAMTQTLEKQLNEQRRLLNLELSPARTKNLERFRTLLGINGIDHNSNDNHDDNDHINHSNTNTNPNTNHFDGGNNPLKISGPLLPTPASNAPRFAVKRFD